MCDLHTDIFKISDEALSEQEVHLKVKRIDPIMGAQMTASEYFERIIGRYNAMGKIMTPAELGCALSHIQIYKQCVEHGTAALVFEKDITPLESEIKQALSLAQESAKDFIHFGIHPNTQYGVFFKGKPSDCALFEVNVFENFHGNFAYYISPRAAKILLEYHSRYINPADSWLYFFQTSPFKAYYYPIFAHPPERGKMDDERSKRSTKVYSIEPPSISLYAKTALKKFLNKFKSYSDIKHEQK